MENIDLKKPIMDGTGRGIPLEVVDLIFKMFAVRSLESVAKKLDETSFLTATKEELEENLQGLQQAYATCYYWYKQVLEDYKGEK